MNRVISWAKNLFNRTDDVKVESGEDLPLFYITDKEHTNIKLYIELKNKSIIFSFEDNVNNIIFETFKNIKSTKANSKLVDGIKDEYFKTCRDNVILELKYGDNSFLFNKKLNIFLEPTSYVNCEYGVYTIANIMHKNLGILLGNLGNLDTILGKHLTISNKLDSNKDAILSRIVNKFGKARKIK